MLVAFRGPEEGVLHHFFSEEELRELLRNYEILQFHGGFRHYEGWCVLARKT
jgi:hypothetical protein